MTVEYEFERAGDRILLRLMINKTVAFDVLTDASVLSACLDFIEQPRGNGMQNMRIGSFGPFDVSLVLHANRSTASFVIDGPDLDNDFAGNQAVVLYLPRPEIADMFRDQGKWA